ncbi:MAG: nucleotide exchange factor GrpE [Clostridium sp.]
MINIDDEINYYIRELNNDNSFEFDESIYTEFDLVKEYQNRIINKSIEIENKLTRNTSITSNILNDISSKSNAYAEIEELKLKNRILSKRENKIFMGVINILDSIDWMFKLDGELDNISSSIQLTKKLIKRELDKMSISELAIKGDLYNDEHQICIDYRVKQDHENNEIYEVIKKGYGVGGNVLRPAEVIVVDNTRGESNGDNRD